MHPSNYPSFRHSIHPFSHNIFNASLIKTSTLQLLLLACNFTYTLSADCLLKPRARSADNASSFIVLFGVDIKMESPEIFPTLSFNSRMIRLADFGPVAKHVVVDIDLRQWGGSALTADVDVPKNRDVAHPTNEIPVTYVPARNTIFLSFALAWAETLNARAIFIGVNALDYSGYPDCRPEYIAAFEHMANLATRAGVEGTQRLKIHAPLQHLSKGDIVRLGQELGVDYSITTSCYDPAPDGTACGHCDACQLRLRGFADAWSTDPIAYAEGV